MKPIDTHSYNQGVKDTIIAICRLITDNHQKSITQRQCQIIALEPKLLKP